MVISRLSLTTVSSWLRVLGLGALLFLAGACASYTEETRDIRLLYNNQAFKQALDKLDESSLKNEGKNRLLYRLEKAMIYDRLGEGDKARKLLIEADKIADELYTVSATKLAASFIFNDAATDYEGEDYERVAIHTQLALSFIGDGNLEAAGVEARKINNKLYEINQKYDSNKNRYAEDAFARYLAGSIHEARDDFDSAIIDYAKALELYAGGYSQFVRGGVPDELVGALYALYVKRSRSDKAAQLARDYPKVIERVRRLQREMPDAGEVIVIHEAGHIATKTTGEFFFGFGKQLVRFSFPVIRKRTQTSWGLTGLTNEGNGQFVTASNVQDMDKIADFTLEDRRLRLIAKQSARLIAKGQLTEQAYKNFGPLGGLAANIYTVVSETADTRSWTLLPEAYFISRARLKPGRHTIEIKTNGRVGQIKALDIKKDKIVILRDSE